MTLLISNSLIVLQLILPDLRLYEVPHRVELLQEPTELANLHIDLASLLLDLIEWDDECVILPKHTYTICTSSTSPWLPRISASAWACSACSHWTYPRPSWLACHFGCLHSPWSTRTWIPQLAGLRTVLCICMYNIIFIPQRPHSWRGLAGRVSPSLGLTSRVTPIALSWRGVRQSWWVSTASTWCSSPGGFLRSLEWD